jgi:hypothetical protein
MPRNILIDPQRTGSGNPNIQFSGSMANTVRLEVLASGSVQFTGVSGSLLSITDSLSGSLFAASDISGLPILEVFSDDRVVMGQYSANALVVTGSQVGVGTSIPTARLTVSGGLGNIRIGDVYPAYNGITLNGSTSQNDYNILSRTTDQTLYINRPNGNPISFREGNTNQHVMASGGNVGIGTGTATTDRLAIYSQGTQASPTSVDIASANGTTFGDARLTLSQQLGSRDLTLLVAGTDSRTDGLVANDTYIIGSQRLGLYSKGNGSTTNVGIHLGTNLGSSYGGVAFYTAAVNASAVTRLAINDVGNVGVGSTTTISARLQVSGSETASVPTMVVREGVVSPTGGIGIFDVQNSSGTSTFFVTGSGRVGVGTNAPQAAFHVVNGTVPNAANLYIGYAGSNNYYDANAHYYRDGSGNLRTTINSSGITPGTNGTQDLGSSSFRWRNIYANAISGSLTKLNDGSSYLIAGNNITITTGSNGSVTIDAAVAGGVTGAGTTNYVTKWTGTSTIGNGIATDNGSTFAVAGNFTVTDANSNTFTTANSNSSVALFNIRAPSGKSPQITFTENSVADRWVIGSSAGSSSLVFASGGAYLSSASERMRIDGSGNVGIGITNPTVRTEINYGTLTSVNGATPNTATSLTLSAADPGTTADGNGTLLQFRPITNRGAVVAIGGINTGTNKDGSGALVFYRNSGNGQVSEAVRLDSSGNVGIGISSILAKLHVNGTARIVDYMAVGPNLNSTVKLYVTSPDASASNYSGLFTDNSGIQIAAFMNDKTVRLANGAVRIDGSSGNVGIGTTLIDSKLAVNGNSVFSGSVNPDADNTRDLGSSSKRWRNLYATNISGSLTGSNVSEGQVVVAGVGGALSGSNNFWWDNTNTRVGIGTSLPSSAFSLTGTGFVSLTLQRRLDGATASPLLSLDSSSGVVAFQNASGALIIYRGGTLGSSTGPESMRIDSSGNVGIGTSTPQALLHVGAGGGAPTVSATAYVTALGTTNLAIRDATNSVELLNYAYSGGGLIGTVTNHSLGIRTGNTTALTIDTSQNAGIGSTTPSVTGIDTGVTRLFVVAPNSNTGMAATFIADSIGRGILVADQGKTNSFAVSLGSSLATIGTNTSGTALAISVAASERVRIDVNGNVGIGTSNTNGSKLAVNGEMSITGSIIPHGDNARDLGSSTKKWRGVFASSGSFSTLVTTAATTSGSYSRTFASGESGRLTATITSLQNENKTVTFNVTHGAVLFDISFVASVSGFSISKKFTVASSYDQPPVSFKLVDTGPYTGNDITVSFSKSTSVTTCTFSHNYSPSASIAITIDVAATSSGISGTTVTIFP